MRTAFAIGTLVLSLAAAASPASAQQNPTKEQIERIKRENEKIAAENALIQQANTALGAKNWQGAVDPLQKLIALDPDNWQYYSLLGDAQTNLRHYDQAVDALKKGVHAADRIKAADPAKPYTDPVKKKAGTARMLLVLGNAYVSLRNNQAAVEAYGRAAAMSSEPAIAYFNLCATHYNAGNTKAALAACDKAIAADPRKADAYFIKGSVLVGESSVDKAGKVTAPHGALEALHKYLELAPNGSHAKDAKEMLAYLTGKPVK